MSLQRAFLFFSPKNDIERLFFIVNLLQFLLSTLFIVNVFLIMLLNIVKSMKRVFNFSCFFKIISVA